MRKVNTIVKTSDINKLKAYYVEALKENPDVDVNLFTYPGPRPQSKITAILMILDSIEAASRSLDSPRREDLEMLIEHIVDDKMANGELNDSGLTLKDIEIICIYKEENSDIDRFVKETQEKYNNIKIIYKTKAQDVTAKNKALEEAQGKYIIVLNGDMCLEKTALEKLYSAQEKAGTDIAICGFNIIDVNTNQLIHEGLNNKFKEVEEVNGKNENFAYLNLDGGNKLIKKEIAKDIGFQNYDECQDEIFVLS